MRIKFIKKTKSYRLTWFARILLLIITIVLLTAAFRNLNTFLVITKPVESKVMVLEGWLPDYTIREMMGYYYEHDFEKLIITGLPTHKGYYVTQYNNTAEISLKALEFFGFDTGGIVQLSIPQSIYKDRTYMTALMVSEYLEKEKPELKGLNIFTLGCHARRSRLLFEKAFGEQCEIGVIAGKDHNYEAHKWWRSSKGFRTVTNEFMAWIYVKLFFNPDKEASAVSLHAGIYVDSIFNHRLDKDIKFSDTINSPLGKEQVKHFTGLKYYDPDPAFRVKAYFSTDTTNPVFRMKTTTDRAPEYRKYGDITFNLKDSVFSLNVYQNIAYSKSKEGSDYLFIPMRDLTSGITTYGGGRYLDIRIPENDSIIIDFNLLYNPYCAYHSRWSCPIPPKENFLNTKVLAGEKVFK